MQKGSPFPPFRLKPHRFNLSFLTLLMAILLIISCLPGIASAAAISCSASDDQVRLTSSNQVDSTDNTWKIDLTGVTLKADVSIHDLDIQGLPEGLLISAQKATSENSIIVTVTGSATISSVTTVSVVVKASAIQDSGYSNSSAINLNLVPASIKVAGSATDNSVRMASGNTSVDTNDNKWVITLSSGNVKPTGLQTSDISVSNLPSNLNIANVTKGTGNTIEITVAGTALNAISTATTVNIVVNGTAVTESQAQNSAAIAVYLNPAVTKVIGSATDANIKMASGNTTIDSSDNKWVITLTSGTVRTGISATDVTITGLPANLTGNVAKGTGNTIEITVTGTANTAISTPPPITVVVKGSAVNEGLQNSDAMTVSLILFVNKIPVVVSDNSVQMALGNKSIDAANNSWTLSLTGVTVRNEITNDDIEITGLPQGFKYTVSKGSSSSIVITVSDTLGTALTAPPSITAIVKNTAIQEANYADSDPVNLNLLLHLGRIIVSASDNNIQMGVGNQSVDGANNSWTLSLTGVTVRNEITNDDIEITGLPQGFKYTVSKGSSSSIVITVSETLSSALTTQPTITVVVKNSAINDSGYLDSDSVTIQLNLASDCFIATAAFGSYLDSHVMALRVFRDQVLLKHSWGRWFVTQYYHFSPPIAAVIAHNSTLRLITRLMLTPIIFAVEYPAYLGIMLLLVAGTILVRRFKPGLSSI
jgi:hypothetical protein